MGNFWDWSWPYFSSKLSLFFGDGNNTAWNAYNTGQPTTYFSAFHLNFLLSRLSFFSFARSEIVLLFFLLIIFILLLIAIIRLTGNKKMSFLIFLTILNPAFFYKLLAGHLSYWVSYLIFICLIYFMVRKFSGQKLRDYLILGLLLSFVGFQIQFFVFAAIFLLIFFVFNRDKFSKKYFWLLLIVPTLVSLPWLSNYLVGANSVSATSQSATVMQFSDAEFASLKRIFFMIFSPATNIQCAYDRWMLIYFGIFSALVCGLLLWYYVKRFKKNIASNRTINIFSLNLIIFTFLGTGYFQKVQIPIIKTFYSMFRESGHFAPIIILFEVLILANILPQFLEAIRHKKLVGALVTFYLIGFISINGYIFYKYLPRVDYSQARSEFQSFLDFGNTDNSTYRVLTYPFWNQYGFNNQESVYKNDKLLNNSGWDSFIENSGKDHISNYQAGGQSIDDTLQYRLLTTNNLSELEQKNVKYLYDLSAIYTSNWEKYTTAETYNNDLSLIKNNSNFISNLIAANPGKIEKVADGIYQIKDTLPRIYIQDTAFEIDKKVPPHLYFKKINSTKYEVTITNLSSDINLNFLESYHKDWKVYLNSVNNDLSLCDDKTEENFNTTECASESKYWSWSSSDNLKNDINQSHNEIFDYANTWKISPDLLKENYSDQIQINEDGTINVNLTIYFEPENYFNIALIISLSTIISCLIILLYKHKEN